jgi:hypothetical protein
MTVIPHPPYSPDLASYYFFLFPKMKLKLKGRRFDTVERILAESLWEGGHDCVLGACAERKA